MAIEIVGDAEAAATSVTLPAGVAKGVLELVYAYRNGSTEAPTTPAGYQKLNNNAGAETNSRAIAWRILGGSETTTGTFTSATQIIVVLIKGSFRPSQVGTTEPGLNPIGAVASGGTATKVLTTPALTLQDSSGKSAVIAFAGTKSTNASTKTLSSTTDLASSQTATNVAWQKEVTSWASRNYSAEVNTAVNRTDVVEILDESYVPPATEGAFKNFRQAITGYEVRNGTTTVTMPAGIEKGQAVIVAVYKEAEGTVATSTEGWELLQSSYYSAMVARCALFYCASYNSKALVFTYTGNQGTMAQAIAFSGSAGLDTSKVANATALTTEQSYPEIETAEENELLWALGIDDNGVGISNPPSEMVVFTDNTFQGSKVFRQVRAAKGKVGTKTVKTYLTRQESLKTNVGISSVKFEVAFKPAKSGEALKIELSDKVAPTESRGLKDVMKRADAVTPAEARKLKDALLRKDSLTPTEARILADLMKRADAIAPTELRKSKSGIKRTDVLASVSEARSLRPGLKRTETQTVAEARKLIAGLKKADIATLAEAIKKAPGIKRTETIAFSDKLARALGINKKDAFALVEVMKRAVTTKRADSTAPTEKRSLRPGVVRKDSIAPTEAHKATAGKGLSETALLAELLKRAWAAKLKRADVITLSDEVIAKIVLTLSKEDAVALSDAISHVWAAKAKLADVLAPTEARQLRSALVRKDTATVVEVIHKAAGPHRADSFSMSDARKLAVGKKLKDTVGLADVLVHVQGIHASLADTANVAEALKRVWKAKRQQADSFGLAEQIHTSAGKHLADATGLTEAQKRKWVAKLKRADVFELIDEVDVTKGKLFVGHENQLVVEALKRSWKAILKEADAFAVTEKHTTRPGKALHESIVVSDSKHYALAKLITNLCVLTEALKQAVRKPRADAIAPTEKHSAAVRKPFANTLTTSDQIHKRWSHTFAEAFALAESNRRGFGKFRLDSFTVVDARTRRSGLTRKESQPVTDKLKRAVRLSFHDSIHPSDFFGKGLGLEEHEAIFLADAFATLLNLGINLHEALEVADLIAKRGIGKVLAEVTHLTDKAGVHATAAHLALIAIADILSTRTDLEDRAELGIEVDDRRSTSISLEDGLL